MQPTVKSWSNNPAELGPLYPWVGVEFLMFLACALFFLGFLVWKIRSENAHYEQLVSRLQRDQDFLHGTNPPEASPVQPSAHQEPIDGQP